MTDFIETFGDIECAPDPVAEAAVLRFLVYVFFFGIIAYIILKDIR